MWPKWKKNGNSEMREQKSLLPFECLPIRTDLNFSLDSLAEPKRQKNQRPGPCRLGSLVEGIPPKALKGLYPQSKGEAEVYWPSKVFTTKMCISNESALMWFCPGYASRNLLEANAKNFLKNLPLFESSD